MIKALLNAGAKLFGFSQQTLEFTQGGKPVQAKVVKAAANAATKQGRQDIAARTQHLAQTAARNRGFTARDIDHWANDAKQGLKDLYGANAALARGGTVDRLRAQDWAKVSARLEPKFQVIDRIAQRAKNGAYGPELQNGQLHVHVGNVANSGRSCYENTRLDAAEEIGHDEFKRVLGDSDNCVNARGFTGCVEAADMDWCSRDEIIEIGDCTCHDGCNCAIISRRSGQRARLGLE